MYVCGITPYDATHLGHAATYLAFDLCSGSGATPATRSCTCRTSPTSMTRCSSGRAHRRELDATSPSARSQLYPRRHGRAAGAAAGRIRRRGRVDPRDRRRDRDAARDGAAYRVEEDIYFSIPAAGASGRVELRPDTMLRAVRRTRRRPGPRRQARSAGLAALAGATATASRTGTPTRRRGRPGWHIECAVIALTGWAWASTCRAAART